MPAKRTLMDLSNDSTLAISLGTAFQEAAPAYGVRLEGIENDVNEHNDFWLAVARAFIAANFTEARDAD